MNYSVITAEDAEKDLEVIVDYISQDNPVRAHSFVDEIIDFFEDQLSYMPRKSPTFEGKLSIRLMKHQGSVRKLVFKKSVLIYFWIDDEKKEVHVIAVKRAKKPLEHS